MTDSNSETPAPFSWKEKTKVTIEGVAWFVTPSTGKSEGNFAFFLSLDEMPDVRSGELHKAFVNLITVIEEYGFTPRVCPDNRTFNVEGIKRRVGGHMVYANKPSEPPFIIHPKIQKLSERF